MTPQELRESIYRRAFQGKLVEQLFVEGTAAETLSGIKYKSAKATDDNIDIPESWQWTYLTDIAEILYGFPFNSEKFNDSGIGMPIIRIRDINNGYSKTFSDEKCDERYRITIGDMLVGMDGNFQVAFWKSDDAWLNQRVCKITSNPQVLIQKYLFYYLPIILKEINGTVSYSTVKHLSAKILNQMLIPFPPLAEQKRIVAKIEELLPLIDRYEQAWSKLEDFNKRFPVDMQKSILQMAIQGKLVPQISEEGTGEELFQQIQAEKQRLIKEGVIKKEKPLPEITEDEIPFDIPDSWKWARLGNISWYFDAGKSPNCLKQPVTGNDWGVITTTAVQLGYFDEVQNKILPSNFTVNPEIQVRSGDILITRAGPTNRTGIACLVKDIHYNLILSDKIIRINMTDNYFYKDYLIMVLNSPQIRNLILGLMSGMDKQQVNVSQDKYKTLLIPIPPLAEQKRIVAKLEEILPLCERLSSPLISTLTKTISSNDNKNNITRVEQLPKKEYTVRQAARSFGETVPNDTADLIKYYIERKNNDKKT